MVFIALPNMQAAQRNTQRRNDYNSLSTMITNYATNHNGSFPTAAQFKSTWLNSKGQDPDGTTYTYKAPAATLSFTKGQVTYEDKKKCKADGTGVEAGANKEFYVAGYIEEGANVAGTYCLSSHY